MKVKYRVMRRNGELVIEIDDIDHPELREHMRGIRIVVPPGTNVKECIRRAIIRHWQSLHPKIEIIEEKEEDFDIKLE